MSWKDACYAAGGFATVFPFGAHAGEPACRLQDPATKAYRYEAADESFLEYLARKKDLAGDQVDIALGDLVAARDKVVDATQGAVPGVLGYALGIPSWAVLLIAGYVGLRLLDFHLPRGN